MVSDTAGHSYSGYIYPAMDLDAEELMTQSKPIEADKEIENILFDHYTDEGKHLPESPQCPECIAQLQALVDKAVVAELEQALEIVEQKNDVEVLNWFDGRLDQLKGVVNE